MELFSSNKGCLKLIAYLREIKLTKLVYKSIEAISP